LLTSLHLKDVTNYYVS